jgi:hypothetical protein
MKGEYSGKTFSNILMPILDDFDIRNLILAITINNASNNNILVKNLNHEFRKSVTEIFSENSVIHISYLAYIIQLTAKIMMERFKIEAKNYSKKVN